MRTLSEPKPATQGSTFVFFIYSCSEEVLTFIVSRQKRERALSLLPSSRRTHCRKIQRPPNPPVDLTACTINPTSLVSIISNPPPPKLFLNLSFLREPTTVSTLKFWLFHRSTRSSLPEPTRMLPSPFQLCIDLTARLLSNASDIAARRPSSTFTHLFRVHSLCLFKNCFATQHSLPGSKAAILFSISA